MTIDDLIQAAEEARELLGGNAEVRIAYQPNYPLRGVVQAATVYNPYADVDGDITEEMVEADAAEDPDKQMLWLAAGTVPYRENPYGSSWMWDGNMGR